MSFIRYVQKSKIPQPSQSNFSVEKWRACYEEYRASGDDDRVFQAGLFFFSKFTEIRNNLKRLQEIKYTKDKLIRLYVGIANREMKVGLALVESTLEKKAQAGSLSMSSMVAVTVSTPISGHSIPWLRAIEGVIAGIRFPLSDVIQRFDSLNLRKPTDSDESKKLMNYSLAKMNMGVLYQSYLIFWQDVLWNQYEISQLPDEDIILGPDSNLQKAASLGEHRSQVLYTEFTHHMEKLWGTLHLAVRKLALETKSFIKITNNNGKKTPIIGDVDLKNAPIGWLNIQAIQDSYLKKLSLVPLETFEGATIRDFLRVYEHLYHLAESISKFIPADPTTGSPPQFLEFAPVISLPSLINDLSELTTISQMKIQSIISAMTFTGSIKEDLWLRPLIPVSSNEITLLISPLKNPNLSRSVDYWLQLGNVQVAEKGMEFEKFVRDRMNDFCRDSDILNKSSIINRSFTLAGTGSTEEIDFIWLLDNKIILGESKSISHPVEPLEWRHIFNVAKDASEQIKRKAKFIQNNLMNFLKALEIENLDINDMEIIPIIILSKPMLSGFEVDGVPVTDMYILERYCEGKLDRVMIQSNQTHTTVKKTLFYDSWQTAKLNVQDYLKNPPILAEYKIKQTLIDTMYPPYFKGDRKFVQREYAITS